MSNEGLDFKMGSTSTQEITRENRGEFEFMWRAIEEGVNAIQPISDHDLFEVAIDDLILMHKKKPSEKHKPENDLLDVFMKNRGALVLEVISLMNGQKEIEHSDVSEQHHDDHSQEHRKVA